MSINDENVGRIGRCSLMETECCREDANPTHAPCDPYAELQDENEKLREVLQSFCDAHGTERSDDPRQIAYEKARRLLEKD